MLKILGILVLLGALLVLLVGVGGAVMNLVFPPHELTCDMAAASSKKADEAKKAYDAAKGTPSESTARGTYEIAVKSYQADNDACGRSNESHRTYGTIFAVVAVFGFIGVLFGGLITIFGFRKKKAA